jgi:hypothetical protein
MKWNCLGVDPEPRFASAFEFERGDGTILAAHRQPAILGMPGQALESTPQRAVPDDLWFSSAQSPDHQAAALVARRQPRAVWMKGQVAHRVQRSR